MALPRWPASGGAPKQLVLVVLGLAVAGGAAVLWKLHQQQVDQLSHQLGLSQEQVSALKDQNTQLTRQLESVRAERAGLDERLSSLRAQLVSATGDLERSQVAFNELQDRLKEFSEERTQLRRQVTSLTEERARDQQQIEELGARKAELEQSAARLRERLALLDRDYRKVAEQLAGLQTAPHPGVSVVSSYGPSATQPTGSAETNQQGLPSLIAGTVELPPIIVRKDRAGMSIPVRGRLVEVNEPHAFVVLDKGSLDGVHVGMVFDVVRGSSTVGRATVVRVRPQLSACDVLRQHTVGPLQSGDEVVQRSP